MPGWTICRTSSSFFSVGHVAARREHVLEPAADHLVDDLFHGDGRVVAGRDVVAVPEDGDPVDDVLELVQPMGDVDDADAPVAQAVDHLEELVDLRLGQGAGWLVHDEHLGILGQGLGDLDHLLLGDGELVEPGRRVDVEVEPVQDLGGVDVHLLVVDVAEQGPGLAADVDVLGHGQVGHEVEFLVDDPDPGLAGLPGVLEMDFLALVDDSPGIRPVDPAQDLHEGRLARAVLADQGMHLALAQLEGDLVQGLDPGKPFETSSTFRIVSVICWRLAD